MTYRPPYTFDRCIAGTLSWGTLLLIVLLAPLRLHAQNTSTARASNRFNVGAGAYRCGAKDCTVATNHAIADACAVGGGVVHFSKATYTVSPQTPDALGAIVIPCDNITLSGAGQGATILSRLTLGDTDPDTACPLYKGEVNRGAGIYVTPNTTGDRIRRNIRFEHLTLTGNRIRYTGMHGSTVWPATPANCFNVWDTSEKGIWIQQDHDSWGIVLEDVEVSYFSGELLYGGSTDSRGWRISHSNMHHSNGDAISGSAAMVIENNQLHDVGANCVENQPTGPTEPQSIHDNNCYNAGLIGIGTPIYVGSIWALPPPEIEIYSNRIANIGIYGINALGRAGSIHDNHILDAGFASKGGCGILLHSYLDNGTTQSPQNMSVTNNTVYADKTSTSCGIQVQGGGAGAEAKNIRVEHNRMGVTPGGRAAGFSMTNGISLTGSILNLTENDNRQDHTTYNYSDRAAVAGKILTTTAATTVVQLRPHPGHPRTYTVPISLSISHATTKVTVQLQYADRSGAVQSFTLADRVAMPVGKHTIDTQTFFARGEGDNQQIKLIVTATIPNNVAVTASINEAGR